jgi:hypothetical protein
VGLERGPLSLVSTIEELLGRNSSGFCLENHEYGHGDPLRCPCNTHYPQTKAMEFVIIVMPSYEPQIPNLIISSLVINHGIIRILCLLQYYE